MNAIFSSLAIFFASLPILNASDEFSAMLSIEISSIEESDTEFILSLQLKNESRRRLLLLSPGCSLGSESLSFVFVDQTGAEMRVTKIPPDSSGVSSNFLSLNPEEIYRFTVNLKSKIWKFPMHLGDGSANKIYAELSLPKSDRIPQDQFKLWNGITRSKPHNFSISLKGILNDRPFRTSGARSAKKNGEVRESKSPRHREGKK